jgi:hypothetical protein
MGRVEYVGRHVIRCSIGTEWYIDKGIGWIPAFAESTPRLTLKGSGGIEKKYSRG